MKKIWIIACAAAAVALAGCNREIQGPETAPKAFRATIETPSRVAFSDEGVFAWQAGDAVALSTNAGFKTFTLKDGAGASVAAFDGDLSGVTSATVAIYPAAIAKDDATVTLPAEYAWVEGQTNAAMFCSQVSLTEVNSFKHLGGIIKVSFADIPADANAMVLKAEAKITGDFAIADGVIAAGVGTDEVKVTFAAGSNPAAFYIPVPTGEYKFSVELQKDGAAIEGTQKATTNPIKVERKALVMMDPIGPVTITIATAEDFMAFVPIAKTLDPGSKALLTADITLPETFAPDSLGCDFDGQGHKVTYSLDIPAEATIPVGLFCLVAEGKTVKNLTTAGSITCAKQNVGGIAGKALANVTFENCVNEVNITGNVKQTYHMGGICGDAAAGTAFKGCTNKGTLSINIGTNTNTCQQGGIVGHTESTATLENCVNDGRLEFTAAGGARTAGIIGYHNNLKELSIINCVNNGEIYLSNTATSGYNYVGGITGYYGTPENGSHVLYKSCVNNGNITLDNGGSKTQGRVGGILCHCGGTAVDASIPLSVEVIDCTNNGDISVTTSSSASNHLGGVIAFTEKTTCIITCSGCTNNGSIHAPKAKATIGSLLGYSCNPASTFTDFTIGKDVVMETAAGGKAGLAIGSGYGDPSQLATALTGKVQGGKIVDGETEKVATAENYKDLLVFANFVGTTDGVIFEGGSAPAKVTIKDFAQEYVKILDIWQATTGTIDQLKGEAYEGGEWNVADAHYVPSTTKITVGGKEYTTGDMFETALRSYLLIRGYNGLDASNYGKDKIAALEGGAVAMSETEVPETHGYYFGTSPFNETPGNGGHLVLGTADVNEHCKVKTDILDNWAMRSLNFQKGQPITNLCGYSGGQLAGYYGCFCSQRALITYAFFFKYMLDNNLDKGTDVAADVIIRSELFGDETAAVVPVQRDTTWLAEWWINDADKAKLNAHYAEEAKEPGTSLPNVASNAAGNGGQYVEPNKSGAGRIEFYNAVDKTSFNPKARVKRTIGSNAITEFGTWVDDYWLMTANPSAPVAAGEDIMVYFAMRANSKNTPKYWLAEIKDGSEWKPLLPTQQATFDGKTFNYNVEVFFDIPTTSEVNSEVDATYTLTQANSEIVVRITCMSLKMAGGTDDVPVNIGDSVGGATENPVIMLVGERTNKNGAPITRHTGIAILK